MDEAKAYKGSQAKFCHYFVFISCFRSRGIFFSVFVLIFPAANNSLL